jgi:hypothetical protein
LAFVLGLFDFHIGGAPYAGLALVFKREMFDDSAVFIQQSPNADMNAASLLLALCVLGDEPEAGVRLSKPDDLVFLRFGSAAQRSQ